MVIFLYNLYIYVWTQHFWGPLLNYIQNPKLSYNKQSHIDVPVYRET